MASEGVDCSGSSHNFTSVHYTSGDDILLACIYRNPLSVNDKRVATLHDEHVFVIIMHMLSGNGVFGARPKRHLASVLPIEYITFDARRRLIRTRNSVYRILHELGEDIHGENSSAVVKVNRHNQAFTLGISHHSFF
jgi:hypothetical protein